MNGWYSAGAVVLAIVPLCARSDPGGYACMVEPMQKIELRSPVEATIKEVHVDRGAVVKKGQALVELDADVEKAALAEANYRRTLQGPMRSAEARLLYANEKLRRRDELRKQNFVSEQERDDASAEARVAEAESLERREEKDVAALEYERLRSVVAQRTLVSPVDGVVLERLQHPGELAQAGSGSKAILKLAQIDPLRVELILPVSLYGTISVGQIAMVTPEKPLGGSFKATVTVVDKVVDSASGTFGVRLEAPNPDGAIPEGVKCEANLAK